MLKYIAMGIPLIVAAPAQADEQSVRSAYILCETIDNTGLASAPCDVSGWDSSVTATLDMNSGEARELCGQIAALMKERGQLFSKGWTFKIVSPYSNGSSIAFCNL